MSPAAAFAPTSRRMSSEDALALWNEYRRTNDKALRDRLELTFAPLADGRVHQLWKQSQDDGRSWTVAFDGTYVPPTPA